MSGQGELSSSGALGKYGALGAQEETAPMSRSEQKKRKNKEFLADRAEKAAKRKATFYEKRDRDGRAGAPPPVPVGNTHMYANAAAIWRRFCQFLEADPRHMPRLHELWKDVTFTNVDCIKPGCSAEELLKGPAYVDVFACWTPAPPSRDLVNDNVMEPMGQGKAGVDIGPPGMKGRRAVIIRQIYHPIHSPGEVVAAFNLPSKGDLLKIFCRPPPELEIIRPHNAVIPSEYNATPIDSYCDIHYDLALNTVATVIEDTIKVWFLFPPMQSNRTLFVKLLCEFENKALLCKELEDSYITLTEAGRCLFLPAGWLHLVYTLKGGFLGGTTFAAGANVALSVSMPKDEFNFFANRAEGVAALTTAFVACIGAIGASLSSTNQDILVQGLAAWIDLVPIIAHTIFPVKRACRDLYTRLGKLKTLDYAFRCPCGVDVQEKALGDHSKAGHGL